MEGYRTYIAALIAAVIAIVNNAKPGLIPLLTEDQVNALLAIALPVVMAVMRRITKTPPSV